MVYLLGKSDIIILESTVQRYLSTKPFSKGRWYYEFTHLEGDNFHLAGFQTNQGERIHIYPQGQRKCLIACFNGMSADGVSGYTDANFNNFTENHTVGLGFDTYSKVFTVQYNDQVKTYNLHYSSSAYRVSPVFLEAFQNIYYTDRIKVNFGSNPFTYKIPDNHLPWSYMEQDTFHSSYSLRYFPNTILLFTIFS